MERENQNSITVSEFLEYLHGYGLVIEDPDAVRRRLAYFSMKSDTWLVYEVADQ